MHKILIIDDDVAVTNYLMVFLMQTETYEPTVINDSRQVYEVLEKESFDAILLDMDMPNVTGLDILKMIKSRKIPTPVIVLTGVGDVTLAVDSMKLGAFDYLTKPVDDDYLLSVIEKSIEHQDTHQSINTLPDVLTRKDLTHEHAFEHVPTRDPKMIRIFHQAEKMASGDLSIFIWGEIGVGKRSLAEAIHKASPRADAPFVVVNAASQDTDEFPANFFGQAKDWSGAKAERPGFLESAFGGTIFIDDIDCLDMPMQIRLKRVIENGEYYREGSTRILKADVRFIVSSNHDLTSEEYTKKFDRDLLYRLMINSIMIPPLRERVDDIPLIAEHLLNEENAKTGKNIKGLAPDFMRFLMEYEFPGNLRELRLIIATAVINEDGDTITLASVAPYMRDMLLKKTPARPGTFEPRRLADIERDYAKNALEYFGNDKKKTALELDISIDKLDEILRG